MRLLLALLLLAGCNPAPETYGTGRGSGLEVDLHRALVDLYRDEPSDLRYLSALVDLDADGTDEALAYVVGDGVCGSGGCTLLVIQPGAQDYRVVSRHTVTQLPVLVAATRTNGWRDLVVHVGGGGTPSRAVTLQFDGTTYPPNPTLQPAGPVPDGAQTMIPDVDSFDGARPLR